MRLRSASLLAALVGFLSAGCEDAASRGGAESTDPGSGGAGGAPEAPSGGPGSSSSSGLGPATSGAGGGPTVICDPSPEPGSLYALSAESFDIEKDYPVKMCEYAGDVLLIVNTAAKCGYTPQYAPLEGLEKTYGAQGFHVLGFLSNDFNNQGGTDEEVEACAEQYGITFEQFATIHVKIGPDQHPIFAWLTSQEGFAGDVTWNFNKFLIGRDGTLVARWSESQVPDQPIVTDAIEAELAK